MRVSFALLPTPKLTYVWMVETLPLEDACPPTEAVELSELADEKKKGNGIGTQKTMCKREEEKRRVLESSKRHIGLSDAGLLKPESIDDSSDDLPIMIKNIRRQFPPNDIKTRLSKTQDINARIKSDDSKRRLDDLKKNEEFLNTLNRPIDPSIMGSTYFKQKAIEERQGMESENKRVKQVILKKRESKEDHKPSPTKSNGRSNSKRETQRDVIDDASASTLDWDDDCAGGS